MDSGFIANKLTNGIYNIINHWYYLLIATNNTGSKKMTLTEALAKLDQMYKDQPKSEKTQDWQASQNWQKQTKEQARAQYNFMRGMP